MRRKAEIYRGQEIGAEQIKLLKEIAINKYEPNIYNEYFNDVYFLSDLAYLHGENDRNEVLVLGEDWFLCYAVSDYFVKILEWCALDNKYKIEQTLETFNTLKFILLDNQDKIFEADMRHSTSYQWYLGGLERGYLQELTHYIDIDVSSPKDLINLDKDVSKMSDLIYLLHINRPEYLHFVLHHIKFKVTTKFIEKYNSQKRIRRLKI